MYPHERSLVQKYKNRPFVLIGVNTDEKQELPEIIRRNNLSWDSFADGPAGPICKAWDVHSFPTTILIDAKGKIRKKDLRGEELEDAIEELVQEAEAASAGEASAKSRMSAEDKTGATTPAAPPAVSK